MSTDQGRFTRHVAEQVPGQMGGPQAPDTRPMAAGNADEDIRTAAHRGHERMMGRSPQTTVDGEPASEFDNVDERRVRAELKRIADLNMASPDVHTKRAGAMIKEALLSDEG